MQLSCNITEIDWRCKHNTICVCSLTQRICQPILTPTHITELTVLHLTRHTSIAVLKIYLIKADALYLHLLSHRLSTCFEGFNHTPSVHVLAWTTIENNNLLHPFLLLPTL